MSTRPETDPKTSAAGCCAPECCADTDTAQNAEQLQPDQLRDVVRTKYAEIAERTTGGCGCGPASMQQLGYADEQAAAVPDGANLGLGCGNPLAHAALEPGETVLDLGSGAGIDAFLAAREVGANGRVLGVDMTDAMLQKARRNAERVGATNVEFRLGEIENLPVADESVDVVISNCVINLSPDKHRVFAEAFRVLRPGGRLVVSDLVLTGELPAAVRRSVEAYVGCVAGASRREDYLQAVRDAGFTGVEVVEETGYGEAVAANGDVDAALRSAASAVTSAKVRARKPLG